MPIKDDPNMVRVRLWMDKALRNEFYRLTRLNDETMRSAFEDMAVTYIREHGDSNSMRKLAIYEKHQAKRKANTTRNKEQ